MTNSENFELEQLYNDYKDMVYRVCLRFKRGNSDWAADRTQEVFLKLVEKWDLLPDVNNPKAFIYRMTVNTCINHLRREKNLINIFTRFFKTSHQFDSVRGTEITVPETAGEATELLRIMDEALDQLNPKQKTVVIMYYFEDIEIPAIAEILGVNKGTVSRRLKAAREKLAEILNYEELTS